MTPNSHEDGEDFDIYGDLDCSQDVSNNSLESSTGLDTTLESLKDEAVLFGELNALEIEVKVLRKEKKCFTEENASLKVSLATKEKQILVLRNNISALYKTAKMELERRSEELANVRREYDSLIFRRRTSQVAKSETVQDFTINTSMNTPMLNTSIKSNNLSFSKHEQSLSSKENSDNYNRSRPSLDYNSRNDSPKTTNHSHKVTADEKYREYPQSRDSTGSYDCKRKSSPLSVNQESNRKSAKYDSHSTPTRSSRSGGDRDSRMDRERHHSPHLSRSASKYDDRHRRRN